VVLALLWANASKGPPPAFDKNTHIIQSTRWFQPIWDICLSNVIIFINFPRWEMIKEKTVSNFKPPTSSNTCLATRPELVKNRDLCKPPVESGFLPSRKWFQPWNSSSLISFDQFINIGVRTPLGSPYLLPYVIFPRSKPLFQLRGLIISSTHLPFLLEHIVSWSADIDWRIPFFGENNCRFSASFQPWHQQRWLLWQHLQPW